MGIQLGKAGSTTVEGVVAAVAQNSDSVWSELSPPTRKFCARDPLARQVGQRLANLQAPQAAI